MQPTNYPQGILFIDIETVPQLKELPELGRLRELYLKKFRAEINPPEELPHPTLLFAEDHWKAKAGLYAEFNQVVCVCIGRIDASGVLLIKRIASRFEAPLLKEVAQIIDKAKDGLCGHNILEFDSPILLRRMWANNLIPPSIINTLGKPKWELKMVDTMEMWSGSAFKYRASLDLLCETLGIKSSKEGPVSGHNLADYYYGMFDGVESDSLPFDKESEAVKAIADYCADDVHATVNCYLKMKGLPVIETYTPI